MLGAGFIPGLMDLFYFHLVLVDISLLHGHPTSSFYSIPRMKNYKTVQGSAFDSGCVFTDHNTYLQFHVFAQ